MLLHKELTDEILNAFYEVYNELGYGFVEKVYQNSLFFELKDRGLRVVAQKRCNVSYKGREVGEFFTDLVIDDLVILELKANERIKEDHELQLQNYLKASNIEIGLVLNFGKNQNLHVRFSPIISKIRTNPPNPYNPRS
jgi:GxxExxY protein